MNKFYIYIYLDNNKPFYVGKGKDKRYKIDNHLGLYNKNPFLERKISKIGHDNIEIRFIAKNLTEEQAFYLEEYYIAGYGRRDLKLGPLCNLTNGGEGASGYHHTEEARIKISLIHKGRIFSESHRYNKSKAQIGRKLSAETREKISKANTGHRHSEESKQKMAEKSKGHTLSEESRKKLSEAKMGHVGAFRGKKFSEEHKRKISEAHKARKKKKT